MLELYVYAPAVAETDGAVNWLSTKRRRDQQFLLMIARHGWTVTCPRVVGLGGRTRSRVESSDQRSVDEVVKS